jgi:NAD(P)-dependent dehydrogenase (short-subunit alcohol dehydrogenase family)
VTTRVALVTGANKGIGLAIARGLAAEGLTVLVGARDEGRGRAAADQMRTTGAAAEFLQIDVSDDASVRAAADEVGRRFGKLDVLVNNAAIKLEFHPSPPSETSMDVVRQTYATNVFGTISVLLAMLPLLRASPSGRVVNMTSGLGSLTYASDQDSVYAHRPLLGYSTGKAAVNAVTVQFANELRGTAIKVNAADPGMTRTDMTKNSVDRTPEEAARLPIGLATLPADGPTGGVFDDDGPVPW